MPRTLLLALAAALALTGCATDDGPASAPLTADEPADADAPVGEPEAADEPTDAEEPTDEQPSDADVQAALESAQIDVGTIAPRLESFYRGGEYPRTLDEVLATIDDAGVELSEGNSIAGYLYDEETVEFTLCVQHDATGAWATYDTRPMSLREEGTSGGCPAL